MFNNDERFEGFPKAFEGLPQEIEEEEPVTVNSEDEAWTYWTDRYGEPSYVHNPSEMVIIEEALVGYRNEYTTLQREIERTEAKYLNEFKINRVVELHFLLTVGEKYLEECIEWEISDSFKDYEYERDFSGEIDGRDYWLGTED